MKILFSLSLKHYDPVENNMKIRHSTGVLSKLFYFAIRDLGEVHVIDSEDNSLKGENFDLLIGLPRNFTYLTKNNNIKVKTVFPNICEGRELKRTLREEAARLGCKLRDAYAPDDYYHADHFFVIGGKHVVDGFKKVGIPDEKITDLYWKSDFVPFKFREKNKKTIFLHSATTFGLRKGVWHVIEDFKKANLDAELWLLGNTQKEKFWIDYIADAVKDPRIKNIGYVSNHEPRYVDILQKADYIVFPSFGEGQVGTVTEAMEAGCLPLYSKESGIEFESPFIYNRGDFNIFRRANDITPEYWSKYQGYLNTYMRHKYNNLVFMNRVRAKIKELCYA